MNAAPIGKSHQFLHGAVRLGHVHLSRKRWRARAALSALFTWAMGMGLAEANPVAGTMRVATSPPEAMSSLT